MKTSRYSLVSIIRCGVSPLAAALLVWAGSAVAAEKATVEIAAFYLAEPTFGSMDVTPSLNVHYKDIEAIQMMISENQLVTGLLTWTGNANVDAQGKGGGAGAGVLLVGEWDFTNPAKPTFVPSPSKGKWETKFEFKGNLNGPYTVKVIGHGVAGEVEGMQFVFKAQWVSPGVDAYVGTILDPQARN